MKYFISSPFQLILVNAHLILRSSINDIVKKNVGTLLGVWWLVASPALFLAIYSVVYLVIFKLRPMDMSPELYLLHIFSGLLAFLFHSEAMGAGTAALEANQSLLKSTVFPAEIITLKGVVSSVPTLVVGMTFILVGTLIFGKPSPYVLLIFPVILLQALFLIGLTWFLSLAHLIIKDIQNLIGFLNMALMIMTPIAYTIDMVPSSLRFIVWLNPLSYFVFCNQALIHGQLPDSKIMLVTVVISLSSFILGYHFFNSFKKIVFSHV